MKYAIYFQFINEKDWILHASKIWKNALVLWFFKKYPKNYFWIWTKSFCIWFYMIEYDVYHRKWCLKWFICRVSQKNIQNTTKCEEILWKNENNHCRFLPQEMMRSKAQNLHARFCWCPGLDFEFKTPK